MLKKIDVNKQRQPNHSWPLVFCRFSALRLGRINFLAPTLVFSKASRGRWEEGGGGAGQAVHHGGFVFLALLLGLDSLIAPGPS